jgi:hypothetical protein
MQVIFYMDSFEFGDVTTYGWVTTDHSTIMTVVVPF